MDQERERERMGGRGEKYACIGFMRIRVYVRMLRRWCSRDSRILVPRPGREKERGLVHTQYRAVRKRQLLDATVRGYGGPIDVKCNNFDGLMSPAAALVPRCTLPNASLALDHAIFFTARPFPRVQGRDLEYSWRHFAIDVTHCNLDDNQ